MADFDHPILVFPAAGQAEKARRFGGGGRPNIPEASRQGKRLAPQFRRLQEALTQRRDTIQGNSIGLEPEQVLVLETVGPISNFIRSVEKIDGLEWLGEYELDALQSTHNRRTFRDYVARFLGYGPIDFAKAMNCTEQRVTVLGFGEWSDNEGAEFALPLPPSLSSVNERRRLTITLAWMSPINSRHQNYRIAHLWFDPRYDLARDRKCADFRAVQRGTVQHEVLEGSDAVDFQDGDDIVIKVNCRNDAGEILEPVRFGLVVTLEVSEASRLSVPIYAEVRKRLSIGIRPGARTP